MPEVKRASGIDFTGEFDGWCGREEVAPNLPTTATYAQFTTKTSNAVFRYALSCGPGLCTLGKVRPAAGRRDGQLEIVHASGIAPVARFPYTCGTDKRGRSSWRSWSASFIVVHGDRPRPMKTRGNWSLTKTLSDCSCGTNGTLRGTRVRTNSRSTSFSSRVMPRRKPCWRFCSAGSLPKPRGPELGMGQVHDLGS
jgi:hypothetical protein